MAVARESEVTETTAVTREGGVRVARRPYRGADALAGGAEEGRAKGGATAMTEKGRMTEATAANTLREQEELDGTLREQEERDGGAAGAVEGRRRDGVTDNTRSGGERRRGEATAMTRGGWQGGGTPVGTGGEHGRDRGRHAREEREPGDEEHKGPRAKTATGRSTGGGREARGGGPGHSAQAPVVGLPPPPRHRRATAAMGSGAGRGAGPRVGGGGGEGKRRRPREENSRAWRLTGSAAIQKLKLLLLQAR